MYFFFIYFNMKRIKLKKKIKLNISSYISLISIFILLSLIMSFVFIGNNVTPKIEKYAQMKAKKIISFVFSQSINEDIISVFEDEELFITHKNNNGTVSSIDFNSIVVNKALAKVSSNVKGYMRKLEKGEVDDLNLSDEDLFNVDDKKLKNGVIYEISTGIIFDNAILANIGPKIPVKLSFMGNVSTDVVTDIKDYGINNAIVQIGIKIVVTMQVVLPYSSSQIDVESIIPVTIKLIQGTVPNYYFNSTDSPSLAIDPN